MPHLADDHGTDQADRAFASFMRVELSAPVDAMGGYIDLLVEDAERHGFDAYAADLAKMSAARERLRALVDMVITGEGGLPGPGVSAQAGKLRHDLRTPIAAILGFGELLAEQARDDGHPAFADTIDGLLEATRRLLAQIDVLVDTVRARTAAPDEAPADGVPTALTRREAIDVIRAVLVPPPETQATALTGTLLVVDDDLSNVDLLTRRLTRDGHAVTGMTSGEEALAWAQTHAVDVILLDLIMPGLNGIEVLRLLRAREETRLTPVIIISGLDEADGAIRCIEAGADDYLAKPVDAVLLRARINSALERKQLRDREIAITQRLRAEYDRAEGLLRNMLPASIVERLRAGERVIADHFDSATILFCDLVGFTAMAATLPPGDTLELLNTMFSEFDRLAKHFGVEKIKTIGDAYMAAAGIPEARDGHAAAIAAMAMRIPGIVHKVSAGSGTALTVRIGIDTGPVAAGIIGTDKFLYDVWGDAVNTASRMEHHGTPGRVHITQSTRSALGSLYDYDVLTIVGVKGKGEMQTYLIR